MLLRLLRLAVRWQWPLRLANPLFGRLNPFLASYASDPYPQYRRLREEAPVYLHPLFRAWVLSRHADVAEALRGEGFSVNRTQGADVPDAFNPFSKLSPRFIETISSSLLMLDPPDHTRIRTLVGKAFTPRRVDALRPRIQEIVDECVDRMAGQGEVDLVREFAVPLPITVIAEMLGVPDEDRDEFKRWSTVLAALLDPISSPFGMDTLERTFFEMSDYFESIFEARRREPRDDLVSALVAAEEAGDRLTGTEMLATCALILGAGHETTTNLIGNAVVALLRNPDERKRLQDDPSLIGTAVEEFLRFDSPVQATDRMAARDLEFAGASVRKGQFVLLLLGAANRDPEVFSEPDRLDLGREHNPHLAFSQGAHFCLGAQLARVEAQIAIETLLRRFPDLSGSPEPPWRSSIVLRGPSALPVRLV